MKSLDIVYLTESRQTIVVTPYNDQLVARTTGILTGESNMLVFKVSTGSLIRKIISLCNEVPSGKLIREKLWNAEYYNGYPGCGKTTLIAN